MKLFRFCFSFILIHKITKKAGKLTRERLRVKFKCKDQKNFHFEINNLKIFMTEPAWPRSCKVKIINLHNIIDITYYRWLVSLLILPYSGDNADEQ